MNPFEYVTSINLNKKDIMVDDVAEKAYAPFMVNRSLSYFADTVFFANEMNRYHNLDNKLQYHFLINIVRKGKRFSKWIKPNQNEYIELIKEHYGYSNEKAEQVLPLLSPKQLDYLKVLKGGKSK